MKAKNEICINGRVINQDVPPYIIAELSANHNGSLENALNLIQQAKTAGADAVKIQTYRADTITLKSDKEDFMIKEGLWAGQSLYKLYESAHTPWEWHKTLFEKARALNITLFSSPFDKSAIDFLEDLNTPAYKIASFEAIDLPLIRYAASTQKPMIISTGMANAEEIEEAIDAARSAGCSQLAILHCISAYPAPPEDCHLHTIGDMQKRFNLMTGLSDHTLDNTVAITSIALGVTIIEKHFTMNRNGGGPDDSFSLEPAELQQLCQDSKTAWSALGKVHYNEKKSEQSNIKFRRSLYICKDLKKGDTLTDTNIISIRPGYGLAPKHIESVIGKKISCDAERGTALTWDIIDSTSCATANPLNK